MLVISRVLASFAVLGSVLPLVAAHNIARHNGGQNNNSAQSCQSGHFFYETKSCCVPHTPPKNPPQPPAGKSCPSSNANNWYWDGDKSCCLPTSPPPPGNPHPLCPKNHEWDSNNSYCSAPSPRSPPSQPSPPNSPPSQPSSPGKGPSSCESGHFWYEAKQCCLPHGGPRTRLPLLLASSARPSGWSWGQEQGCCIPHSPPENNPPPQCQNGWNWIGSIFSCIPSPSPPSSPAPKPSGVHHYKKRSHKSRYAALCPDPLTACAVSTLTSDWECVDIQQDLEACGGCVTGGQGQDCTAIAGSWNVGCEAGSCKVYTCMSGFTLAADQKSCTPQ